MPKLIAFFDEEENEFDNIIQVENYDAGFQSVIEKATDDLLEGKYPDGFYDALTHNAETAGYRISFPGFDKIFI